MINISRVTELTAHMGAESRPKPSVAREIQRAITLDAGRSSKKGRIGNASAVAPPRCGKCGKLGHKTEDHIDNFGSKKGTKPSGSLTQRLGAKKSENTCFKCGKSWSKGHKCDPKDLETNNMEVETVDFTVETRTFAEVVSSAVLDDAEICGMENENSGKNLLHTPVLIKEIEGVALVDSGASVSFLSQAFVQKHEIKFTPVTGLIQGGNGMKIAARQGKTKLPIHNGSLIADIEMEIIELPPGRDMVIGLPDFPKFGYRIEGIPSQTPGVHLLVEDISEEDGSPAVDGLTAEDLHASVAAHVNENTSIPLTSRCNHPLAILRIMPTGTDPIWRNVNYVSRKDHDRVTERVKELLEGNVIEEAPEDCVNCFALLTVPKKDSKGEKVDIRPCLDLRPLNPRLKDIEYPLPKIRDVIDSVGSAKGPSSIYSHIDIKDSYFRFRVLPEERNWISFKWERVHYRFKTAPFGIKSMTAQFQRVMEKIFGKLPFVAVYVDDIVIFSENRDAHITHVICVMERLNKWNIPIRKDKSRFGQKMIYLLGYQISGDGVQMDSRKVSPIRNWKKPETAKQLQRFLGMANYYRQFVRNFSTITAPLDRVRKATGRLEWTDEMKDSFQTIKDVICQRTLLTHPDDRKQYVVGTDASATGVGAWIGQFHGTTLKFIAFASRALSKSERNYAPTKLELLGIIFALVKFDQYLTSDRFVLYTDHRALTYLFTQKHMNNMIINWFDKIMRYNFKIVHVPGIKNTMADALSRTEEISLAALSAEHLLRDKIDPKDETARSELVKKAHRFGHFGEDAIFKKILTEGFWWKGVREDIRSHIASCTDCQRYNIGRKGFHPPRSVVADLPWDHVAVDLVTPLPLSSEGYDTLLVVVDVMTKFCILRTLKGKSMKTIAQAFWELMSTFGVPKILQSDNGSEFVNKLVSELTELNQIDHRTISAYNPRANGQVERTNQVIENILKKELRGERHRWAEYVPYAQLAYNTKISSVTGCTPFALMFGRQVNKLEKYTVSTPSEASIQKWKSRQKYVQQIVYPTVSENVLEKKGKSAESFSKHHRIIDDTKFPVGASVMMLDKTRGSKWDPVYEGPFIIVRRNRGGAYVLRDKVGETLKRTVPSDQLKLIHRKGDDAVFDMPSLKIKNIASHRTGENKTTEYLVVWKDPHTEPSWEPVSNFDDINVIKKYWSEKRPTRGSKSKLSSH